MNPISRQLRPDRLRPPQIALIGAVAVALTATLVAQPWAGRAPEASPAPSTPAASATSGSGPEPEDDWAKVVIEDIPAVATLAAIGLDAAGIGSDATFALTSLTTEPAIDLAQRLEISPPTEFRASPAADPAGTIVTPTDPLAQGAVYRFALRGTDGGLAGSWAFQVRSPIHVLSTVPGDKTTAVPIRTGIEVTFDQDGTADMADWFSISPAVDGRFERHGRTQVFVPDALAAKTLYTVTIRAGLPRDGTDLELESDVVFRFETEGESRTQPWLRFGRDVVETGPTEAAIVAVEVVDPDFDGQSPPAITSADIVAYRLPSLAAATDALRALLAAPRWAEHTDPLLPMDGLPAAARFTAPLEQLAESQYSAVRFPAPLDEGWYVVEVQGARRSQAFLQVTPVSAWVAVLTDRTVVWVNDVSSGAPIAGASVSIAGGAPIGTSAADGLMTGATPAAILPDAEAGDLVVPAVPPVLSVRSPSGDTVLVPFEVGWDGGVYRGEWWEKSTAADATYWSLLTTDRTLFRASDRIEAWGYLRHRDDDTVPRSVELRLISDAYDDLLGRPAITRATVTPDARGAYAAAIAFRQLPLGSYRLIAVVDGRVVASRWIEVSVVRKPAYQLAVEPDRRAVIAGTTVSWTMTATFFDGAPVPSTGITVYSLGEQRATPTDADGRSVLGLPMRFREVREDADYIGVEVRPSGPEEGEIWASSSVLVFPSDYHLEATGVVEEGRLRVTGSLDAVDLAKVEAGLAAGEWNWDDDPDGAPIAGATLHATVTELIPVKRLVGNDYDFIEKVVRPRYEWSTVRTVVGTPTVSSGSDGRIAFDLAIPDATHQYEVRLSTTDGAGREARRTLTAGSAAELWWHDAGVEFQTLSGEAVGGEPYRIGESITWRMTDDGEPLPEGGTNRYLYVVSQRGLRGATVTDSMTFDRRFGAADAPGVFVMGVRFTGSTYAPKASAWADFELAQRALTVTLTADRARYRPGEAATITVRATDAAGRPAAASVVLQAVDEKIYAMGGAETPYPLENLHARVDSGIVRLTSTHQVPTMAGPEGEGGDTTGGGETRADFRDTLVFRTLQTGADGTAATTVRLSDDLTSWHVTAAALTAGLEAGTDELLVPVGLPLFVDATIADEYLVADRPSIRLRAFGEAVRAGDPVEFTISSRTLGMAAVRLTGTALADLSFELPGLSVGSHELDISVISPTRLDAASGKPLSDRLLRRFTVVSSRLTAGRSDYGLVGEALPTVPGAEAATYTFTDAGRGRYLPLLLQLAEPAGARLDRGLAQQIARDLLVDVFGRDPSTLPAVSFDPNRYPVGYPDDADGSDRPGGIALLPYGGADPWLAARVALVAPEGVYASALRDILAQLALDETVVRDLRIAALAGLAGAGEPVLGDLRAALATSGLTTIERLHLALGFRALGDDAAALGIEREVLREHGQQLGPWVRVTGSDLEATLEATSLTALLAAGLGDPLAPRMTDYVIANPSRESTHALELAGAARWALERNPGVRAAFAWTVDDRRTVVRLDPGESETLVLTPEQSATLRLERVEGEVAVAVAWRELVGASSIATDPSINLTRTPPPSPLPTDRLVTVRLTAEFGSAALASGCYEVVEQVPSGLAPVGTSPPALGPRVVTPTDVVGQRVTFCVPFDPSDRGERTVHLAYSARVVNEGAFSWEPAVMQLPGVPEAAAVTAGATTLIGD